MREKIIFAPKVADESREVVKEKTGRTKEAKNKGLLTVNKVLLHDDAAKMIGLMMDCP